MFRTDPGNVSGEPCGPGLHSPSPPRGVPIPLTRRPTGAHARSLNQLYHNQLSAGCVESSGGSRRSGATQSATAVSARETLRCALTAPSPGLSLSTRPGTASLLGGLDELGRDDPSRPPSRQRLGQVRVIRHLQESSLPGLTSWPALLLSRCRHPASSRGPNRDPLPTRPRP